jgi:hypothetical protein
MWLLKFHKSQEFHNFKISDKMQKLYEHLHWLYKDSDGELHDVIEIKEMQKGVHQVFVNGEEVGFIGWVVVL